MPINVIFKTTDSNASQWWESKQNEIAAFVVAVETWKAVTMPQFPKSKYPDGRKAVFDHQGIVGVEIESGDHAEDIPFAWSRKDKLKMYIPRLSKPEGEQVLKEMTAFKRPTSDGAELIGIPHNLNIARHNVSPAFEQVNDVLYAMYEVQSFSDVSIVQREVEKSAKKAQVGWTYISTPDWLAEVESARAVQASSLPAQEPVKAQEE